MNKKVSKKGSAVRQSLYDLYIEKFTALFVNMFEIENMHKDVSGYIMTKLLTQATLSAWKLSKVDNINEVGFSPYVLQSYDMYGNVFNGRLINERGSSMVDTNKVYTNHVDLSIIKLDTLPMRHIESIVNQLVDIDMTIRTNIKTLKMPFVVKSSDAKTLKGVENLLDDDIVIELNDSVVEVFKTDTPYNIDKLQRYKVEKENELYTYLGIDNVKFEKAAQMNNDEVNANNGEINTHQNIIKAKVTEWLDECNELFGSQFKIKEPEVALPEEVKDNVKDNETSELE